ATPTPTSRARKATRTTIPFRPVAGNVDSLAPEEFDQAFALLVDLGALFLREPAERLDRQIALRADVPGRRDEAVDQDRRRDVPVLGNDRRGNTRGEGVRVRTRCAH